MLKNKNVLFEEYDPPLPERVQYQTKEDKEKLQTLTAKYKKMSADRKAASK